MGNVKDVNEDELQAIISDSEKMVFIDFWADWCGPCRMVAPVVDEVSIELDSDFTFVKSNVDENPNSAAMYGVRSIPTFVVLKGQDIVFRHSGAVPKSFLIDKLSSLVN